MADYTWPVTLPQNFLVSGYRETLPNTAIRTDMDAGPAKIRQRVTSNVRPVSGSMVMTETQLTTFESFFNTTIVGGTLRFNYTHPRLGAVELRFVSSPSYTKVGDDAWLVEMGLEIMP